MDYGVDNILTSVLSYDDAVNILRDSDNLPSSVVESLINRLVDIFNGSGYKSYSSSFLGFSSVTSTSLSKECIARILALGVSQIDISHFLFLNTPYSAENICKCVEDVFNSKDIKDIKCVCNALLGSLSVKSVNKYDKPYEKLINTIINNLVNYELGSGSKSKSVIQLDCKEISSLIKDTISTICSINISSNNCSHLIGWLLDNNQLLSGNKSFLRHPCIYDEQVFDSLINLGSFEIDSILSANPRLSRSQVFRLYARYSVVDPSSISSMLGENKEVRELILKCRLIPAIRNLNQFKMSKDTDQEIIDGLYEDFINEPYNYVNNFIISANDVLPEDKVISIIKKRKLNVAHRIFEGWTANPKFNSIIMELSKYPSYIIRMSVLDFFSSRMGKGLLEPSLEGAFINKILPRYVKDKSYKVRSKAAKQFVIHRPKVNNKLSPDNFSDVMANIRNLDNKLVADIIRDNSPLDRESLDVAVAAIKKVHDNFYIVRNATSMLLEKNYNNLNCNDYINLCLAGSTAIDIVIDHLIAKNSNEDILLKIADNNIAVIERLAQSSRPSKKIKELLFKDNNKRVLRLMAQYCNNLDMGEFCRLVSEGFVLDLVRNNRWEYMEYIKRLAIDYSTKAGN